MQQRLVCVTGLPRAGSTLLCQLLAEHPEIYSDGMSSALFGAIQMLRARLSDSDFLLAQLDNEFDRAYARLQRSCRAFAKAWWDETDCPIVVDKNRGWLNQIELAEEVDPEVRMVVCIRELGQIFGSIEAQHQKTVWLDFPDDLAGHSAYSRAEALFSPKGVVGAPLASLCAVQDRPPMQQERLFFVIFEHLMAEPQKVMADVYQWLGVSPQTINFQNLTVRPHESDSYYRFKYRHATRSSLSAPHHHPIPGRIDHDLKLKHRWFYEMFYPGAKLPNLT
ncbi:MAG: sulfotransferase [Coleofasciculaceae cyanobacterium RL_1_1]|nr:sulfotransferase [Coleofasciculaceae cyanobacterium RL_1_1]